MNKNYENEINKLLVMCYQGKANAETFEKTIKNTGLTMEVMNILFSYYEEDLKNYERIKF